MSNNTILYFTAAYQNANWDKSNYLAIYNSCNRIPVRAWWIFHRGLQVNFQTKTQRLHKRKFLNFHQFGNVILLPSPLNPYLLEWNIYIILFHTIKCKFFECTLIHILLKCMDLPEWAFLVANLENPLLIDVIWAELLGGIPHLKTRLFTPPSSLPLFVFHSECLSLVLWPVRTPWEEPIPTRHGRELCEIWAFKCFINNIQEDLCFKSSPAISRPANPA